MKDEIKEMLQEIKETVDDYLKIYKLEDDIMYDTINYKASQWYALLDYITNLQKELERYKHYFKTSGIEELMEENEMYSQLKDEYEDIIEKAIKYNYELQERYCHSALFDEPVASKIYEISEKQLNILQGVGKGE